MNLPIEFVERTRLLLGEEAFRLLENALQSEAPVSIRINQTKCDKGIPGQPVLWASSGFYSVERPTFTFDPLFHAGCYYVQEASSMFVEQALRTYVSQPVVMLDLCAAPGGKSTHVRSLLPEGSLLVTNEVMRNRSNILAENMMKWGHSEVIVTNNDPADFASLPHLFDVILTDVPCSGEGMFRKDAVAVEEWSVDNVQICRQRQRRILTDIWTALKPGGLLIYSTCTYNREENEDNVAWIARELGAEILPVPVCPEWGVTENCAELDFPVYRFLPHKTMGEGFFLAVLRKDSESSDASPSERRVKKNKDNKKNNLPVVPKQAEGWLNQSDDFLFEVRGAQVVAFPKKHLTEYTLLNEALKVIHAGVTIGEIKGKDLTPDHSLAMSTSLNKSAFPMAKLTYEQAITYLRKEVLMLDASIPCGYVLLTYDNVPLGFVKNIGNRANNLYPREWRIRSGYLPESLSFVWND